MQKINAKEFLRKLLSVLVAVSLMLGMLPAGMVVTAADSSVYVPESTGDLTFSDVSGAGFKVELPTGYGESSYTMSISCTTGGVTTVVRDNIAVAVGDSSVSVFEDKLYYSETEVIPNHAYEVTVNALNAEGGIISTFQGSVVTVSGNTVQTRHFTVYDMPVTQSSSDDYHVVSTLDNFFEIGSSNLQWKSQNGFNNQDGTTSGRDSLQIDINSMRLFNLTDKTEISLDYGNVATAASIAGLGNNPGKTPWDVGSVLDTGDFTITKAIIDRSTNFVFKLNADKYLEKGKSYAVVVGPEFRAGGGTLNYLNKINIYKFTVKGDPPVWSDEEALNVGTVGEDSVTLNWLPATDDIGITQYNIVAKNEDTVVKTYTQNNTTPNGQGLITYNADELTSNTDYTFEVTALTATSESSVISASAKTAAASLTWPADAQLEISNLAATSLTLTWPEVLNPEDLSGYTVYVNGSEENTVPASQAYYELGGLDAGSQYTLGVRAINKDGISNSMLQTIVVTTGGGGLTFTLSPTVIDLGEDDYYHNYIFQSPIDPDNFSISWNFSNGLDKNLRQNLETISLVNKNDPSDIINLDLGTEPYIMDGDTGTFSAGDFLYITQGSGTLKVRRLIFNPSDATKALMSKGSTYVLSMGANFMANNGTANLGKIFNFKFTIAVDDIEAPKWSDGALTAIKTGTDFITLSWPAASDNITVAGYDIYQLKTSKSGTSEQLLETVAGDITTYTVSSLSPGVEYSFIIRAKDAKSNASEDLTGNFATLLEDIDAPTWPSGSYLKAANIKTDNLDLSWSIATDNVDVTGYRLIQGDKVIAVLDSTTFTYHVTGLKNSTSYSFEVEAKDSADNWSTTGPRLVVGTAQGAEDTEAPEWTDNGTRGTATKYDLYQAHITYNWPWATDNVGVYGYLVYRNGYLIATLDPYNNSYTDTVSVNNTDYTYTVYAVDYAGNKSEPISHTVGTGDTDFDLISPVWPEGTNITLSEFTENTVKVSWTPAQDNRGICQYEVLNGPLWVENLDLGAIDNPHKNIEECWVYYDNGEYYGWGEKAYPHLVSGNTYTFSIKTWDYSLNGSKGDPKITFVVGTDPTAGSNIKFELSNVENTRGSLNSITGALNNITAAQDPENIEFIWDFAEELALGYESNITLTKADDSSLIALTDSNLNYINGSLTLAGLKLEDDTDYIVKFSKDIEAVSGKTTGLDIGWKFTTAKADKIAPTWTETDSLSVNFIKDPTIATLSWPEATDNVGVTQYKVYNGGELIETLTSDKLTYDVTGLNLESHYDFKVVAGDYLDNFNEGLEAAADTPAADNTAPSWANDEELTFSSIFSDNVTVSWPAASDNYEIKLYEILKDGTKIAEVEDNVITYVITGLSGDSIYNISVKAIDYSGNSSELSKSVTTAPDDVKPIWPDEAELTAMNIKDVSLTLNWTAATDNVAVTGYNIYQDGTLLETIAGDTTQYEVSGLNGSTNYNFEVQAFDLRDNKTTVNLTLNQWTAPNTINGGAQFGFNLKNPASVNIEYDSETNTLNNAVDGSLTKNTVSFGFTYEKTLTADSWLDNFTLVKEDGTEVTLDASAFTYTESGTASSLKIAVDPSLIDNDSYKLTMGADLMASDSTLLGRNFTWAFAVSAGAYGITDIATGFNPFELFMHGAERFYVMLKDDGSVWTWGNNDYGTLGDGTTTSQDVPTKIDSLNNIVSVVAGRASAFAIDKDGNVYGWGSNEYGQLGRGTVPSGTSGRYGNTLPVKIEGLPPIEKISYGYGTVIAIDIYGQVWDWGLAVKNGGNSYENCSGIPLKVEGLNDVIDVAVGQYEKYAVTASGDIYKFRRGDAPAKMSDLSEIKAVSARGVKGYGNNVMALKTDGTIYIWDEDSSTPIVVANAVNIKKIVADGPYVIGSDNKVYTVNYVSGESASMGSEISGLGLTAKLASCYNGGLDLQQNGTLLNFNFLKDNKIVNEISEVPLSMDTADAPIWSNEAALTITNKAETAFTLNWEIVDSNVSSYVIYQDGNRIGSVSGDINLFDVTGLTKGQSYSFKVEARYVNSGLSTTGPQIECTMDAWNPSLNGVGKIAVADNYSLLVASDGTVYAWGQNEYGQLGLGDTNERLIPTQITGLTNIVQVSAGYDHSVALDSDGNVWTWGRNNVYQLGDGTKTDSSTPIKVSGLTGIKAISAAGNYTLALKADDGSVYVWGDASNNYNSITFSGLDGKTPGKLQYNGRLASSRYNYSNVKGIAASPEFMTILWDDGTISRTGRYVAPGITTCSWIPELSGDMPLGTMAIAAGDDFVVGLMQDGRVMVAGDNSYGQFGMGTQGNGTWVSQPEYNIVEGPTDIVSVAAGESHVVAVDKNGAIWTWGMNQNGQLGNGKNDLSLVPQKISAPEGITIVGAGGDSSIAYKDDTAVYAWGENGEGQFGNETKTDSSTPTLVHMNGYESNVPAPEWPAYFGIYVAESTESSISIIFTPATSQIGVEKYEIYVDGNKVGEIADGFTNTYTIDGLTKDQEYTIGVMAIDSNDKKSVMSNMITAAAVESGDRIITDLIKVCFMNPVKNVDGVWDISTGSTLAISFSEAINYTDIGNKINVSLMESYIDGTTSGETIECDYSLTQGNKLLLVEPKSALKDGTLYQLSVAFGGEPIVEENKIVFSTYGVGITDVKLIDENGDAVTNVEAGKIYTVDVDFMNLKSIRNSFEYEIQVRGGAGARLETGGVVLAYCQDEKDGLAGQELASAEYTITIPEDYKNNIYIDVFVNAYISSGDIDFRAQGPKAKTFTVCYPLQ